MRDYNKIINACGKFSYDKVIVDAIGQQYLSEEWYAEACHALYDNRLDDAVQYQEWGRFRSKCARTALFQHIDEKRGYNALKERVDIVQLDSNN